MSVDYWLMRAQVSAELEACRMIEEIGNTSVISDIERNILEASRLIGKLRNNLKGSNSTGLEQNEITP
jgi:hypothetical protein